MLKKVFVLGAAMALSFSAWADITVNVHKDKKAQITNDDTKKLILGISNTLSDGSEVKPVALTRSSINQDSDPGSLGRTSSQVYAYLAQKKFTGTDNPPKKVANPIGMIKLAANDKIFIGHIDKGSVNNTDPVLN